MNSEKITNLVADLIKNPFKTNSFQSMFFISFIMFALFLILLFGITGYLIMSEEIAKLTTDSQKQLLAEINKQLHAQMEYIEYDSLVIGSNPKVIHFLESEEDSFQRIHDNSEILDMLNRPSYVKESVQSIQLYAVNNQTNQLMNASGVLSYDMLKNNLWYDQIKNADNGWIGVHQSEMASLSSADKSVVSFARKVNSSAGKEIGLLVINVKLNFIMNMMKNHIIDTNRYVLDSNERLIMEISSEKGVQFPYENYKGQIKTVLEEAGSTENAVTNLDQKVLMIWKTQDDTQWTTLDIIPWTSITKGSSRIKKNIVISGIACTFLSVLMAVVLSSQFVKPIRRLIYVMNQVKAGKLDTRIQNNYNNEFGNLYDNFNHMINRIRILLQEVEEQSRRKREAEIRILESHINPHFLYNTLDTINWRAIDYGAKDVSRMLSLLGKMLRIGLSKGAMTIQVHKELEYLNCYIELQKIHYNNNIQFNLLIPESVTKYFVPKMLFQPFIENSIIHGFHSIGSGTIEVTGMEKENEIIFIIRDNGLGIDGINDKGKEIHNSGIGIRNVEERIELYYGFPYGIDIESRMNKGTTVTIRLPKITSEQKG